MFGTNANIFGVPVPLKITDDDDHHHVHTWTHLLLLFHPSHHYHRYHHYHLLGLLLPVFRCGAPPHIIPPSATHRSPLGSPAPILPTETELFAFIFGCFNVPMRLLPRFWDAPHFHCADDETLVACNGNVAKPVVYCLYLGSIIFKNRGGKEKFKVKRKFKRKIWSWGGKKVSKISVKEEVEGYGALKKESKHPVLRCQQQNMCVCTCVCVFLVMLPLAAAALSMFSSRFPPPLYISTENLEHYAVPERERRTSFPF